VFLAKHLPTLGTRAPRHPRRAHRPGFEALEGRLALSPVGSPFQVDSPKNVNNDMASDNATSPSGEYSVIVWKEPGTGGNHNILAQVFSSNGKPVGQSILVDSNTAKDDDHPAVTMDGNGNFVVTWAQTPNGSTDSDVLAKKYSALGKPSPQGIVHVANTTNPEYEPDVACDVNGRFFIAYTQAAGQIHQVDVKVFNQDMSLAASRIAGNLLDNAQQPSIAASQNNGFVVAYVSSGPIAPFVPRGPGIYLSEFSSQLNTIAFGAPVQLGAGYDHPNVATFGSNPAGVVVYNQENAIDLAHSFCLGTEFVGTAMNGPFQVGQNPIALGTTPDVVVNPTSNNFAVAYVQRDPKAPKDVTKQGILVSEMTWALNTLKTSWTVGAGGHNLDGPSEPALGMDQLGHYLLSYTLPTLTTGKAATVSRNIMGQLGVLK
jgi:hypothetical protein